ncbi:acetylcholine receptor subunit beta-like [Asterias amurensis]|uniref:acetylcholine receptor subunit beta-like n=1 Tax=Asterias amurensis TaxID=7602 RepID=UPI003AB729A1
MLFKGATWTLLSLGVFAVISKAGGVSPWNEEQRWVSEKLDPARYDVATRPVKNITDVVNVTVEMTVFGISLDSRNQELSAKSVSNMGWEDKRLSWNTSEYSGMESIVVKANRVWYPNILILNAIGGSTLIPSDTEVLVTNEGAIFVRVSRYLSTTCYLNQELFPYDTQVCSIYLGTRGTPSDVVSLTALQHGQNEALIAETTNWVLKNASLVETFAPACIEHSASVSCRHVALVSTYLCIKRLAGYYVYTAVIPVTILTVMASFVFLLPSGCGEKLSFSVSVFFGFVIFQLVLLDGQAETGDGKLSILLRYVLFTFVLTGIAVIESAITLILRNQNDNPEARLPVNKVEPLKNDNEPQDDSEVTVHGLQIAKSVPRNWEKIAVYVDRISFVLFWIVYITVLITLVTELLDDPGCPEYL